MSGVPKWPGDRIGTGGGLSGVPKWPGDRIGTALSEASRTAQEIIFPCLCETEDRRGLVHINISTFTDFRETLHSYRVQHSQFVICHSKIVNIFQTINHVSVGLKWDDSSSPAPVVGGVQGAGRMVVRPLYRPLYPAYSFDIWKFLLFLS